MKRGRISNRTGTFLLCLLAAVPSLRAQVESTAKTFPDGCIREEFQLASSSMGRKIPVVVLRPPSLGEGTRIPVLYALHGRKASGLAFSEMSPLREYLSDHPMLVVSFQADEDSCYIDAVRRPHSLFTTFLFEELMPHIAKTYPITGQSAVTGFSMGGFGAFHYMLSRPEAFASVSALSGAFELFDLGEQNEKREEWRPWSESLLGPAAGNPSLYEKVLIRPRLQSSVENGVRLPPLLILCGTEDYLQRSNRRFIDLLHALNTSRPRPAHPLRFEYREAPGGHDWPYWRDHIAQAAAFHWEHFCSQPDVQKP